MNKLLKMRTPNEKEVTGYKRLASMLKKDLQRKKAYKQALKIKALKRNIK